MAGTLNVDTIQNGTGTKPPAATRGEFVQVRIDFNGTGTVAINDSFGVSSLTDSGTGIYVVVFSSVFGNALYSPAGQVCTPGTIVGTASLPQGASGNKQAGQCAFAACDLAGNLGDFTFNDALFVGDYA